MERRQYWDEAWAKRTPESASWYQAQPEPSLGLIRAVTTRDDRIVDIGGGASGLAGALVAAGYSDVTVLDVSATALATLGKRLGDAARLVRTLEADVLEHAFERDSVAAWHDRAVFHFLVEAKERARYREQLELSVRRGGHAVIGTFALDGPEKCSGLTVERYDESSLMSALGPNFRLVDAMRHEHRTPSGSLQPFTFVVARRI